MRKLNSLRRQMYEEDELLTMTLSSQITNEEETQVHRGSVIGRQVVPRDQYSGYIRLMNDYFVENPVYGENLFRHRSVFLQCQFHFCQLFTNLTCHFVIVFPGFECVFKCSTTYCRGLGRQAITSS
jgi:hypothetical protein